MNPSHRTSLLVGTTVAATLISCSGLQAQGVWIGGVGNYNNPINWDDGNVPDGINTVVNNGGTIQVTDDRNTFDILAGTVDGGSGTWEQNGGILTQNGGWFRLGVGHANASGTFTINGGTLNTSLRMNIGEMGTGVLNINGGVVNRTATSGDAIVLGSRSGADPLPFGTTSHGTINHSAGILNTSSELWIANGAGDGSEGGQYNLSGTGELNISNWFAIGRRGGTGVFTMTGGTVNKTGGGNVTISTGTGGQGTVNQSGGVFNNQNWTFVGESWNGDGNGTWNLSGTGEANLTDVILGNGGASTGTFNLDGGTLTANVVRTTSTGASTFTFNGGTLKAGQNRGDFMAGLSAGNVDSGGAIIDSNGFNIGIAQSLLEYGGGGGGLTKNGGGVLTLSGANTYTGGTTVNGGVLVAGSTAALPGWDSAVISLASGTGLGAELGGAGFSDADFTTLMATHDYQAGSSVAIGTSNGGVTYSNDLGTTTSAGTGVGLVKTGGNNLVIDYSGQTFTGDTHISDGALVLDDSADVTYNGAFTGIGTLYVEGAGTTTLNGSGTAISGRLIVGDGADGSASGNGTVSQSSGDIVVTNEVWIGNNGGGSGTYNLSGTGSLYNNSWFVIGRFGSTGELNMTGGQLTKSWENGGRFIVGDNGTGTVNQSGGDVDVFGEVWIGQGGAATGEYNIGGGATLEFDNWLAIGRDSGQGTLNMTGGTVTKTGGGNISLGTGATGNGTINQSGGVFNNTGSETWLGEDAFGGGGTATWTLSGSGEANLGVVLLGRGGSATGTFNLDGGTLSATLVGTTSGGASTFNFNGGTLKAAASEGAFMQGLTAANVEAGGAVIDSNGFDITIGQALVDGGGNGGLTKSGSGTLTLGGVNTYTGATTIDEGTLALGAGASIDSSSQIIVGASATFDASAAGGFTLGTGQTLGGTGSFAGAITIAAGATLAPGESIGTVSFIDALTLQGTSDFEIDAATDTADLAVVAAALVFGGDLNVTNIGGTLAEGQSFDLFDFDNGQSSGAFASVSLPDPGAGLFWDQSALYSDGLITVIPESSASLLAAVGALALLRRRR